MNDGQTLSYNNIELAGNYLCIPLHYIDKGGIQRTIAFFMPISFIKTGDFGSSPREPENFLGVNLKMVLEDMLESK